MAVAGAALAAVLVFEAPAQAHLPLMLDKTDRVPWKGPLIVDGTNPIAVVGTLPRAGATRAFQLNMRAGQDLIIEYLVPDVAPENALSTQDLPRVVLIAPDFRVTVLTPNIRERHEFSDPPLAFLMLREYAATAIAGTYSIVVTGRAPARFVIATGIEENTEFNGIERGSLGTEEQVREWYRTPPSR